jgi:hypothetical protein
MENRRTSSNLQENITNSQSDLSSSDEIDLGSLDLSAHQSSPRIWTTGNFSPRLYEFIGEPGIRISTTENSHPLEYFEAFIDEAMVNHIVEETNRYQLQNPVGERQNMASWKDTSLPEMYSFLAIIMLTGILPKNRIRDYWSTDNLLSTPIFSQIFTRNRFQDILRFLHFSNNDLADADRLVKIKPIIIALKDKFSNCTNPTKNLCIDESLMLWKGRLAFKQYIPSKRNRFGVKLFEIVDCQTRVVLDFIIYTGSTTNIEVIPGIGISGSIVMELMKPYLHKGHNLFVDNWYTSPNLFDLLHRFQTGACGTVRQNRGGLPTLTSRLTSGHIQFSKTNNMLALKWQDKNEVFMLSTIHDTSFGNSGKTSQTGQIIYKPVCVIDYTKNMGAVDGVDMQISSSEYIRKSIKWYKKLFFHLLDLASYDSYAIYRMQQRDTVAFSEFRLEIIRAVFEKYGSQRSTSVGRPMNQPAPLRLTERHFPSYIPNVDSNNRICRRRCVVCSSHQVRTVTTYICTECDAPLCVPVCFKDYHTKLHY